MNYPFASESENGLVSFKGIINSQERYVYYDEWWEDYKDCDDLRTDVLKQLTNGQDPLDSKLAFDNFPIKGYTQSLGTKTVLELSGNSSLYYGTKDHSSTTIRFVTHTGEEKLPTLTQSDVKWGLMPCYEQYDEVYADGEQVSGDPTRYNITARNATGKRTRAYFTIKGIGTCSTKIYTDKMAFINVDFPFNGIEDQLVYSYTGKEIRPCTGVSVDEIIEQFIEGEDFEFIYTDNNKCGLATVDAKPIGDRIDQTSAARAKFVIVPAKPVIKNVTTSGSRLTVEIEDQSESNPSGYRIQYRAKGETEWQESFSKGTSPFVCAYDVEPEKEYEVQVSGYTEVIEGNSHWWYGDRINYGETSEIKTVTTPSADDILRICGDNRYATAAEIAKNTFEKADTVVLAYGMNYADALAGVSLAAAKGAPILYLNASGELDKATADYLESVNGMVKKAFVIGGSGVISDEMMKTAGDALGIEPTRVFGKNRFETNIAVNDTFKEVLTGNCVCAATGADFPDALAGGVYAALNRAPLLLVTGTLSQQQTDYLKNKNAQRVVVFGGKGAVSDELANKIASVNNK